MDKITIDMNVLDKHGLNITEYLILLKYVYPNSIDGKFAYRSSDLESLEKKGFIKIMNDGPILREKTKDMFHIKEDLFLQWLNTYPIKVNKSGGGSRVLSPKGDDTIEGRRLRKKWNTIFKGKPEEAKKAIKVLELELAMRRSSNDLEFMVEASRWLNGGYHEKYEYLIDEGVVPNRRAGNDYEDDWK